MAYATRITHASSAATRESRSAYAVEVYPACPLAARPAGSSSLLLTWEDLLGRR